MGRAVAVRADDTVGEVRRLAKQAKDVAQAAHQIKSLELSQRIANLHSDIVALVEENVRLNDVAVPASGD